MTHEMPTTGSKSTEESQPIVTEQAPEEAQVKKVELTGESLEELRDAEEFLQGEYDKYAEKLKQLNRVQAKFQEISAGLEDVRGQISLREEIDRERQRRLHYQQLKEEYEKLRQEFEGPEGNQ